MIAGPLNPPHCSRECGEWSHLTTPDSHSSADWPRGRAVGRARRWRAGERRGGARSCWLDAVRCAAANRSHCAAVIGPVIWARPASAAGVAIRVSARTLAYDIRPAANCALIPRLAWKCCAAAGLMAGPSSRRQRRKRAGWPAGRCTALARASAGTWCCAGRSCGPFCATACWAVQTRTGPSPGLAGAARLARRSRSYSAESVCTHAASQVFNCRSRPAC
jgi:hypothetical protein